MAGRALRICTILCTLCPIILQLVIVNVAGKTLLALNDETTGNSSEWILHRSKRSPSPIPPVLTFRVEYPTGENIFLKWTQQSNYIANENLPIIKPMGQTDRNVMENIGEFILYRDDERCSAVVYFRSSNTLSGVIGLEYSILDLPYEFDGVGNYMGKYPQNYIIKRPSTPLHNLPPIPDTFLEEALVPIDQPGPCTKRQRTERDVHQEIYGTMDNSSQSNANHIRKRRWYPAREQFFFEIMIIVTRDVVDKYAELYGSDGYLEAIVKDYIIHFNAVDMMFQKLRNHHRVLYINIARIIIDDDCRSCEFIKDSGELQFEQTISMRRAYLKYNEQLYPRDSYDYVFISTSHPIEYRSSVLPEMTDSYKDIYEARKIDRWHEAVPITIMGFAYDYPAAVHAIGRVLHLELDSWSEGRGIMGQCYGIMQQGGPKCKKCLTWSAKSAREFVMFFTVNLNRCFLSNYPRSLRAPGPSIFISPFQQCRCYGFYGSTPYHPVGEAKPYVKTNDCDKPLPCRTDEQDKSQFADTIRPLDGTKCSGANGKVCWNGKCTKYRARACHTKLRT